MQMMIMIEKKIRERDLRLNTLNIYLAFVRQETQTEEMTLFLFSRVSVPLSLSFAFFMFYCLYTVRRTLVSITFSSFLDWFYIFLCVCVCSHRKRILSHVNRHT